MPITASATILRHREANPSADRLEVGAGEDLARQPCSARERGDRHEHAGELHRRKDRDDRGGENGGGLTPREHRQQKAKARGRYHVQDSTEDQRREATLERHLEHEDRERHQGRKLDERDGEVR